MCDFLFSGLDQWGTLIDSSPVRRRWISITHYCAGSSLSSEACQKTLSQLFNMNRSVIFSFKDTDRVPINSSFTLSAKHQKRIIYQVQLKFLMVHFSCVSGPTAVIIDAELLFSEELLASISGRT